MPAVSRSLNISSRRFIVLIIFLVSLLLLLFGFAVEYFSDIRPCLLCWMQRFMFMGTGAFAFIAFLHAPKRWGVWIYGVFGLLFTSAGIGFAARQLYLQSLPPGTAMTCLPGIKYLFKTMPFTDAINILVKGTAECGIVNWTFLGLSMAAWAAIWFFIIAVLWIMYFVRSDQ